MNHPPSYNEILSKEVQFDSFNYCFVDLCVVHEKNFTLYKISVTLNVFS